MDHRGWATTSVPSSWHQGKPPGILTEKQDGMRMALQNIQGQEAAGKFIQNSKLVATWILLCCSLNFNWRKALHKTLYVKANSDFGFHLNALTVWSLTSWSEVKRRICSFSLNALGGASSLQGTNSSHWTCHTDHCWCVSPERKEIFCS